MMLSTMMVAGSFHRD